MWLLQWFYRWSAPLGYLKVVKWRTGAASFLRSIWKSKHLEGLVFLSFFFFLEREQVCGACTSLNMKERSEMFWISEFSVQSTVALMNPDSLVGVQEWFLLKYVLNLVDDLAIRYAHIILFHRIFSSGNSLCYYSSN